jgi:hypothetical protein
MTLATMILELREMAQDGPDVHFVAEETLSPIDGSNVNFRLANRPIVASSVYVTKTGGSFRSQAGFTVDVTNGLLVFSEIPSFVVQAGVNDHIDFTENGGAQKHVVLTAGTYPMGSTDATTGSLCALVKTMIQTAGTGTFSVAYNSSTMKMTITRSTGTFTLLWSSGTYNTSSACSLLGWNAADTSDAIAHTSNSTTAAIVSAPALGTVLTAEYYFNWFSDA